MRACRVRRDMTKLHKIPPKIKEHLLKISELGMNNIRTKLNYEVNLFVFLKNLRQLAHLTSTLNHCLVNSSFTISAIIFAVFP